MSRWLRDLSSVFERRMLLPSSAVGLFFSLLSISGLSFARTSFPDRVIGGTTLIGIDAELRMHAVFLRFLAVFVGVSAIALLLMLLIRRALNSHSISTAAVESNMQLLWAFSALLFSGLLLISGLVFNQEADVLDYYTIRVCLICMLALLLHAGCLVAMNAVSRDARPRFGALPATTSPTQLFFLLATPFSLSWSALLLLTKTGTPFFPVGAKGILLYFLFFGAELVLVGRIADEKLARASVPLLCLPLAAIAVSEAQYALRARVLFPVKPVSGIVFLLLLLIATRQLFGRQTRGCLSAEPFIENNAAPVLLVTTLILCQYQSTLWYNSYDLLHLGNRIVPLQQLFSFGKIPYVDYWPAQQFPLGGILYSLINGYSALEPLLWASPVNDALCLIISYFLMKNWAPARPLLLGFLFLPMSDCLNFYYIGAFLPLLYFPTLYQKRRIIDGCVFSLLSLVSFAWMPSMGKISIILCAFTFCILDFRPKALLRSFLSMALVFSSAAAAYFGLVLLRGESIPGQISLIQAFASLDFLEGAYPVLATNSGLETICQYVAFPLATAALFVYCLFRRRSGKCSDIMMLLVALAALVCIKRAYARHCLIEGFQLGFYGLLVLIAPFFFGRGRGRRAILYLAGGVVSLTLLMNTYVQGANGPFSREGGGLAAASRKYVSVQYSADSRRYEANTAAMPTKLLSFLDEALSDDETFFELLHAHLLYTFTDREAPFLHHNISIVSADAAQNEYVRRMEKRYENGDIPLILLHGGGIDGIDGVPQEICQYRIMEFINFHYQPWAVIDGYEIWVANNSDIPARYPDIERISWQGTHLEMNRLANIWGTYDDHCAEIISAPESVLTDTALIAGESPVYLDCSGAAKTENGNYVYLRLTNSGDANTWATLDFGTVFKADSDFSSRRARRII